MTNFKESFNSYLSRYSDDIYMLSQEVPQLKNPIIADRKFLLDKFENRLRNLLEQTWKLQDLNR